MTSSACRSTWKKFEVFKDFFQANPVPEDAFENNRKLFTAMFNESDELWKAYNTASWECRTIHSDTLKERRTKLKALSDAAAKIGMVKSDLQLTNIKINNNTDHHHDLTADEIANLDSLIRLVERKMSTSDVTTPANTGTGDQMLKDFMDDMEKTKILGLMPANWTENHRIWKCVQHAERRNIVLKYDYNDVDDGKNELWNKVVDEFKQHATDAPPLGPFKKFAVDLFACTINHYRRKIEKTDQSLDGILDILERVAEYTSKIRLRTNLSWIRFADTGNPVITRKTSKCESDRPGNNGEIWKNEQFFDDIYVQTDARIVRGNVQLTRERLFACAATMFNAVEPTALLWIPDHLAVAKVISKIYDIEWRHFHINEPIKLDTSEYLMRLLKSQIKPIIRENI